MDIPKNWPDYVPHTIEYPETPLFSLLDESAEKHPDATATVYRGARLSYRELKEQVDRFATALQKLGVAREDKVALFLPNIPHRHGDQSPLQGEGGQAPD